MVIKKYRCTKCGSQDFFLSDQGQHTAMYCNECGKWIKWASKDDRNLFLKLHLNGIYGKVAQDEYNRVQ